MRIRSSLFAGSSLHCTAAMLRVSKPSCPQHLHDCNSDGFDRESFNFIYKQILRRSKKRANACDSSPSISPTSWPFSAVGICLAGCGLSAQQSMINLYSECLSAVWLALLNCLVVENTRSSLGGFMLKPTNTTGLSSSMALRPPGRAHFSVILLKPLLPTINTLYPKFLFEICFPAPRSPETTSGCCWGGHKVAQSSSVDVCLSPITGPI